VIIAPDAKAKNKKSKDSSDSEMSGGELSYLSTSAHTGGEFSDSVNSQSSSESQTQSQSQTQTQTQNKNKQSPKIEKKS